MCSCNQKQPAANCAEAADLLSETRLAELRAIGSLPQPGRDPMTQTMRDRRDARHAQSLERRRGV